MCALNSLPSYKAVAELWSSVLKNFKHNARGISIEVEVLENYLCINEGFGLWPLPALSVPSYIHSQGTTHILRRSWEVKLTILGLTVQPVLQISHQCIIHMNYVLIWGPGILQDVISINLLLYLSKVLKPFKKKKKSRILYERDYLLSSSQGTSFKKHWNTAVVFSKP